MSLYVEYIKKRISENKNFMAVVTGPTGSGKSYSALRLAEEIDPDFSIDRVVFDAQSFLKVLNHGGLKSGSVVVFDEAGVGMSSREWQSVSSKLILFVLQTFRHKNYIVFFTTPHLGFIEAGSRKLFHCYMETVGINKEKKQVRLKPLMLQVNQRAGDTYFKYLRVRVDGRLVPLKRVAVPLPSQALLDAYEDRKTAFTTSLNQEIEGLLAAQTKGHSKPLTTAQKRVVDLLDMGYKVPEIAKELRVAEQSVYDHMRRAENKGWKITPIKIGHVVSSYEVVAP
jgi:hypothetical protein